MPSACTFPHPDEFPGERIPLPWRDEAGDGAIIGHFARDHGALVPDRLVTSAKSWLSNPHIDPTQRTLPWKSDIAEKLSRRSTARDVTWSISRRASSTPNGRKGGNWELSEGQIVLTVPASFDEVARNLTAEAAEAAGLGKVTLLEEPLAAFYAWTAQAGKEWRAQVGPGDIVLVCDVGGGTADFSLIAVTENEGALAWSASASANISCSAATTWTWRSPMRCAPSWRRKASDRRLAVPEGSCMPPLKPRSRCSRTRPLDQAPIAVPSRGSSLLAGTYRPSSTAPTLEQVVLDGFFPKTEVDDLPKADPQHRAAGVRPALRLRSRRQQAPGPLPGRSLRT